MTPTPPAICPKCPKCGDDGSQRGMNPDGNYRERCDECGALIQTQNRIRELESKLSAAERDIARLREACRAAYKGLGAPDRESFVSGRLPSSQCHPHPAGDRQCLTLNKQSPKSSHATRLTVPA